MKKLNTLTLLALALASVATASAAAVTGKVVDAKTQEPLIGATILLKDTSVGVTTDYEGNFKLNVDDPAAKLAISYITYQTQELDFNAATNMDQLFIQLQPDNQMIASVKVVAKANLETEANLQNQRISSNVAIENIGAREMAVKGLSNAEESVKKMTGISIADAGEVFVRGLGDRYSLTTLNGLPVASPNPDNKLIPLDIFPSSTIQSITVSKVYKVGAFADYSGALIDISTKDAVSKDFFAISASVKGRLGTTGEEFYTSDRPSLWKQTKLSSTVDAMTTSSQMASYIAGGGKPFNTGFDIEKSTALPAFGLQLGGGKSWKVGENANDLSLLVSAGASNDYETINDGFVMNINSDGDPIDRFNYNAYGSQLKLAALGSLSYAFNTEDRINYTVFFARNAEDEYKLRRGLNNEGIDVVGSNSVLHVYTLLNNQLHGHHSLADAWKVDWSASYATTTSSEPDRRQVMYYDNEPLTLFKLNSQETMRYFGDLKEDEIIANAAFKYLYGEDDKNQVRMGAAYRTKDREYNSMRFYYDLKSDINFNPTFENPYSPDAVFDAAIANGTVPITVDKQPNSKYFANSSVAALFAETDYNIGKLLLNVGLRFEYSNQEVKSWRVGAMEYNYDLSTIKAPDLFPSLNLKYGLTDQSSLRLSASRTVTRPSFIEMAPFQYQESYGSTQIVGNPDITNGYNYNFDLRYDIFAKGSSDMLSASVYYKYLQTPIERIQEDAGGSTQYTFENSDDGTAAGIEFEARKTIYKDLRLGLNASYMFTQVVLEEGGGFYTDSQRQLQGASPYLVNADISYGFKLKDESAMRVTLLYNLQGPRIDAVGVGGLNNVIQESLNTLDFVYTYNITPKWTLNAKFSNLLDEQTEFTQEESGEKITVGSYTTGIEGEIGVSFKF